jgi:hypothetical protein
LHTPVIGVANEITILVDVMDDTHALVHAPAATPFLGVIEHLDGVNDAPCGIVIEVAPDSDCVALPPTLNRNVPL